MNNYVTNPTDLNELYTALYQSFNTFSNKDIIYKEICSLEHFIEQDCYSFEQFQTQLSEIEQNYTSTQINPECTTQIFEELAQLLRINSTNNSISSINKKSNNKLSLFTKLTTFVNGARDNSKQIALDDYIPKEYRLLYTLEHISIKSKIAISEYLITGYHQSGFNINNEHDINEYITNNELFKQLQSTNTVNLKNIAYNAMKNYMIQYEKRVHKPLPRRVDTKLSIVKYKDNIDITAKYMIQINNSINHILSTRTSYPIQFDVFFVAPNTHNKLNLHSLGGLDGVKSNVDSRKNAAAIGDIYRIIRDAALDINRANGQRFIMLIVRGNMDDTINDTIYVYKPRVHNFIVDKHMSDYVELMYLLNSKSMIVPGLLPNDAGVLGFTHHLHEFDCNKIYISYGNCKSRVFKNDILNKLKFLFDWHNDKRHIIGENTKIDFINNYRDLSDAFYTEIGEYWFNNNRSYECYEPIWDSDKSVSKNLYMPNDETFHRAIKHYIDENFDRKQNIFNDMYIIDSQTTYFKFPNHGNKHEICVIKTGLHKNGEPLYIIAEPNMSNANILWKLMDYRNICDVFMTIEQLENKFGIFGIDLPKTIVPITTKRQKLNPVAPIFVPATPSTPPSPSKLEADLSTVFEEKKEGIKEEKKEEKKAAPCGYPHPSQSETDPVNYNDIYNIHQPTPKKTLFIPNYPARARLNIFIHKELTLQLSNMIDESFKDTKTLYYYMDISTALQINDQQMYVFDTNRGKVIFVNYDLHNKRDKHTLYGVIQLNDDTQHKPDANHDQNKTKWQWKLYHFATAQQIFNTYGICSAELPQSSRKMDAFSQQLNGNNSLNRMDPMIIENTLWKTIEQIKSAKKNKNKNKRQLRLNIRQWINQCKNTWNNIQAIPIVIIDKNINVYKHWIEWVKLVRFNGNKYIALSCKYTNNKWEITSIILDKGDIVNKHILCGLTPFQEQTYLPGLNYFNTSYTRIQWRE